jgi:hypothetical protein
VHRLRYAEDVRSAASFLWLWLVGLPLASSVAAPPEVLLATGSRLPDGYAVADIGSPVTADRRSLVVDVGTEALLMLDGTHSTPTPVVVAKSGDPAPSVPGATLGTFGGPILGEDGRVAFTATLDGSPSYYALFRRAGDSIELLTADSGGMSTGAMNQRGDIVYRSGARLRAWRDSTRTLVTVAQRRGTTPLGSEIQRIGIVPRLSEAGVVLSLVETRDRTTELIRWPETGEPETVLVDGMATPLGGLLSISSRGEFASNEAGEIALVATSWSPSSPDGAQLGVFLSEPNGALEVLAATKWMVGGRTITDIEDGDIFFDAQGGVVFEAELDDDEDVWLRAADGSLAVLSGPLAPCVAGGTDWSVELTCGGDTLAVLDLLALSDDDPPGAGFQVSGRRLDPTRHRVGITTQRRTAIAVDRRGVRTLVRTGQQLESLDAPVAAVGSAYATSADSIAVVVDTISAQRAIVVFDRSGGVHVAARSVDQVTQGDPFLSLSRLYGPATLAMSGDRVVFLAYDENGPGLFRATRDGGTPRVLARAGDPAPNGGTFTDIGYVAASAGLVVFQGAIDDEAVGVFGLRHERPFPIFYESAGPGDDAPFPFGPPVVRGHRVVSSFAIHVPINVGVARWSPRRGLQQTQITTTDEMTGSVGLGPDVVVAETFGGVFTVGRRGRTRPVVLLGDASPLGGTLGTLETTLGLATGGRRLVVTADLTDASAREALIEYELEPAP